MKDRNPSEPEAVWKEKDISSGKVVDAMVAILRTSGCRWSKTGGCTMCGYNSASMPQIGEYELLAQLNRVMERYDGEPFVKIYTSGSFLDTDEIPLSVRERIFEEFSGCERILFESRPEFINEDVIKTFPKSTTVALGLESSDPQVLSESIRKGFTPEDNRRVGMMLHEAGISVRTYLLLKPLYMTESQAIEDTVRSAMYADPYSDEISINPLNIQRRTQTERLWKRGEFRSPWIWSLLEVMRRLSGNVSSRLMSSPSGGGTNRGVHNCGECDRRVLEAVEKFSLSQDIRELNVTCTCVKKWEDYRKAEKMLGTSADLERGIINDLALRM